MNEASKQDNSKSRFAHPSLSGGGLGKIVERARNVKRSVVQVERDGQQIEYDEVSWDFTEEKQTKKEE